jgi:hypothetical protein
MTTTMTTTMDRGIYCLPNENDSLVKKCRLLFQFPKFDQILSNLVGPVDPEFVSQPAAAPAAAIPRASSGAILLAIVFVVHAASAAMGGYRTARSVHRHHQPRAA